MKVGIDGRELGEGVRTGIGRYLETVIRATAEAGWQCVIYGDHPFEVPVASPMVEFRLVRAPSTLWWDQVGIPRRLREDGVSVFLSPYYKGPLFSPCPVVLTVHDLYFIHYPGSRRPGYDWLMARLAKLYASRASAIITDSEYSKRSVVATLGVSPDKIQAIPLGLPPCFQPTSFTKELQLRYQLSLPYILYVGNFKPHKNLTRLLEAYSRLHPRLRKWFSLVVAGRDEHHRPALQAKAEALGLGDGVLFPGLIGAQDLPAVYSGAAVLMLPSLVEGFGLTALEAMACGCPVAAADRAAIPEVVGEAAVLFNPEDVESIAAAMTSVLGDTKVREQCRQRGLKRVGEFSPERTTGRVLALLREVVQGPPSADRTGAVESFFASEGACSDRG